MRIIRYQGVDGKIGLAEERSDGTATALGGGIFSLMERTNEVVVVKRICAPVEPRALICIGLNYREHAMETGAPIPEVPVVFFKNPGAVQDPRGAIVLPRWLRSNRVDYEAELAVVIGRVCKNVRREEAMEYVLGFTCANDVSARDWQKEGGGGQWSRGKSFDTFCPLGPVVVTPDELGELGGLRISTRVNGELLQESHLGDMIFDVPTLIEFLSGSTTLLPGTVILTGTPAGVGMARKPPRWLEVGDEVKVEIEKIGTLTNSVVEEEVSGGANFSL